MPNLTSWRFMACDGYTTTWVLMVIGWSYPRWAGYKSYYLLSFIAVTLRATWAFVKCSKLLLIVFGGHVWSLMWNGSSRVVACVSRARTSLLLLMGCWILFIFQPLSLRYGPWISLPTFLLLLIAMQFSSALTNSWNISVCESYLLYEVIYS